MFKGINSKALKKAQEKLNSSATSSKKASLKDSSATKAGAEFWANAEIQDYIPRMPGSAKGASAEVEALKNILKSTPSGSSSRTSSVGGDRSGVSEAGAGEFVSYKKYTASGRSLASTKVVDLRSYKKPGIVESKPESKPLSEPSKPKTSTIDPVIDEEDDDAFFRRIFGDDYAGDGDKDAVIEQQKNDTFEQRPVEKPVVSKKSTNAGDDIFSRRVQFVKNSNKKRATKPKKKKLDIDIISGGSDGDII